MLVCVAVSACAIPSVHVPANATIAAPTTALQGAVLMIACRRYGRKPAARSSASVTSEVAAERCHDKQ
jgi:hypothetical protein